MLLSELFYDQCCSGHARQVQLFTMYIIMKVCLWLCNKHVKNTVVFPAKIQRQNGYTLLHWFVCYLLSNGWTISQQLIVIVNYQVNRSHHWIFMLNLDQNLLLESCQDKLTDLISHNSTNICNKIKEGLKISFCYYTWPSKILHNGCRCV